MTDDINELSPRLKLTNVLMVSFAFMLMFTGFQTCNMVSQTVLNSYINETTINGTSSFHGDGYTSLAIIYIVFAFANWLAPSVVSVIGPKYSMFVGSLPYIIYLATFIKPLTWTLYVSSTFLGFGAASLWTAQGNFLTINSTKETMARNSGLFWAIQQTSFLIGNLYVFFAWKGVEVITGAQRVPLFIGFTVVCAIGSLGLLFLIPAKQSSIDIEGEEEEDGDDVALISAGNESAYSGAYRAFVESVQLFKTREMALLGVTFFYTGLELTFYSGVYSTSVAATKKFGADSDKLVGLIGIVVGCGEILGGLVFGIFGKKTIKYGRSPIVLLGGVLEIVAFFLIFLNLPNDSPIAAGGTFEVGYMTPNSGLAIFCGFLLGFCDACFNTQCYSIIGGTWPNNSAAAFALFMFVQCMAAAIGFFYSSYLTLQWQLLLLCLFDVAGMLTFFVVERGLRIKEQNKDFDHGVAS